MTTEIQANLLAELRGLRGDVQSWPQQMRPLDQIPNDVQASPSFEKKRVLKSCGCRAFDLFCINNGGDVVYWQIWDRATPSNDNDVPLFSLPVSPGSVGSLPFKAGCPFANGLTMAASSDPEKLTLISSDAVRFIATLRV